MKTRASIEATEEKENPALIRLKEFENLNQQTREQDGTSPVIPGISNWVPVGPLAIPNGQTYGGARVLVSGRVTSIVNHPTLSNTIYLGTSRGGVWKTMDGGNSWRPMSDHAPSLAIGCLDICNNNPDVLYAGTGEGNLQFYSTNYALNSAPGIYLGVGVLKSVNGGLTWNLQGPALLANHSFYNIKILPSNPNIVFGATSLGLVRTLNGGTTWTSVTGGGLPGISASVIACTDVLIDKTDATGNTVFVSFWGSGIYKSTNALAATPTWTLCSGLPVGTSISRISLCQSASNPNIRYALLANSSDAFGGVYKSNNLGTAWILAFSGAPVQLYGAFTSDINVDPVNANVVYVSGVELYKAIFNPGLGTWAVTNVGSNIHPDSHTLNFDPLNSQIIYSGNDGGIYKSNNGGTSWSDSINKGLSLLQFECIDHNNNSDAIVIGGTQDNGTELYRNSPVWHHSDDGDGGYCAVNRVNNNHMLSSYYGSSFKRSTLGGQFGTWSGANVGINGSGLFYPPMAMSPSSGRTVVGTSVINIDDSMGTGGWPGPGIALPGMVGRVSAVTFASDNIIYAGTTDGKVYRLDFAGGTWSAARVLHAAPLPTGWIWDIQAYPGNVNKILVVFANFGISHAWIGNVPAGAAPAAWTNAGAGLPNVPAYAIAFESASIIYVGTDLGVYRSINGGLSWNNYNQGMPNTAIYDLKYHSSTQLLRAGTHGRGMWEIHTANPSPSSDLFFRDHGMHTGRQNSSASVVARYSNPSQNFNLNDNLYWWQSVDIKVDSPNSIFGGYQMAIANVNYLTFETTLLHENPEKGNVNRVYVQVHNRGNSPATNVVVKILYTGASAGLPNLQANFWTSFPANPSPGAWIPIGSAQTIPLVEPLKPVILEWDWNPPVGADTHSCMLVVMDSASDPIPVGNKTTNINALVPNEKRVALKNLHLVNIIPLNVMAIPFSFFNYKKMNQIIEFDGINLANQEVSIALPKDELKKIMDRKQYKNIEFQKLSSDGIKNIEEQFYKNGLEQSDVKKLLDSFDLSNILIITKKDANIISEIDDKGINTLILLNQKSRKSSQFSIIQKSEDGTITGGSTFILKPVNN
jgi:photosystem II stability/assembly factor-like uncharacterized protein